MRGTTCPSGPTECTVTLRWLDFGFVVLRTPEERRIEPPKYSNCEPEPTSADIGSQAFHRLTINIGIANRSTALKPDSHVR